MRGAYTLVEVLVAGAILVTGLLPILSLLSSSSTEAAKARDKTVAVGLAISVAEELRMRRDLDRATVPPTAPDALAHLSPILQAYATERPEFAAGVQRNLGHFRAGATVPTNPTLPMQVLVTWTESGVSRRHELEAVRGAP